MRPLGKVTHSRRAARFVVGSLVALAIFFAFLEIRDSLLFREVSDGDLRLARILINVGANVNAREEEGETPLMYAAVAGRTDVLLLLLDKGAQINAISENKETALGRAAYVGETGAVRILLEHGANSEMGGNYGTTPLMYASSRGYTDTARLLIEKGAKPNATDEDGDSALMYAATQGAPKDTFRLLITAGADVKHKNKKGKTAEALAVESEHMDVAEMLRRIDGKL